MAGANVSSGKNASSSAFIYGGVSSMLDDGVELEKESASASSDFHTTDVVKIPPSLDLPQSAI
jgi:hypothetical protein